MTTKREDQKYLIPNENIVGIYGIAFYLGISEGTVRSRIKRRQWNCLPEGMFKTSPRPHAEWRCSKENVIKFRESLKGGIL